MFAFYIFLCLSSGVCNELPYLSSAVCSYCLEIAIWVTEIGEPFPQQTRIKRTLTFTTRHLVLANGHNPFQLELMLHACSTIKEGEFHHKFKFEITKVDLTVSVSLAVDVSVLALAKVAGTVGALHDTRRPVGLVAVVAVSGLRPRSAVHEDEDDEEEGSNTGESVDHLVC